MTKPNKGIDQKPQKKIRLPQAKAAVDAYCAVGGQTDPDGMYTGRAQDDVQKTRPVQDADDL